jgi:hypothetical protein
MRPGRRRVAAAVDPFWEVSSMRRRPCGGELDADGGRVLGHPTGAAGPGWDDVFAPGRRPPGPAG